MNESLPPRRRGRLMLLGVVAVFALPLALAWLMFANTEGVPADEVTANGELIDPARPLDGFSGHWTIVQVGGADCGETCRRSLWESRQVRLRLGRDADRVERVYLLADADRVDDAAFFAGEHPRLEVVPAADALLERFVVDGEAPAGHVFLVDPLGNLMMRYSSEAPPEALYKDLKRLLRLSRIG